MLGGAYKNKRRRFLNYYYKNNCPVYCAYCATKLLRKEATIDHVVPRARGGRHTYTNFVISCNACNNELGRQDFMDNKHPYPCNFCGQNHNGKPGCPNKSMLVSDSTQF